MMESKDGGSYAHPTGSNRYPIKGHPCFYLKPLNSQGAALFPFPRRLFMRGTIELSKIVTKRKLR